jgi:hypothetical protein
MALAYFHVLPTTEKSLNLNRPSSRAYRLLRERVAREEDWNFTYAASRPRVDGAYYATGE